jgi:hypothetical protein
MVSMDKASGTQIDLRGVQRTRGRHECLGSLARGAAK